MSKINFALWPNYAEDEIEAVSNVLKSGKVNYWTGEECRNFEKEFALYTGTEFAISLANGTNALELALYALGINEGDEVILTSRSFFASASSIIQRKAKPVFVDVDLESQNINVDEIEKHITKNTKAIIAVHLAGWPCEMDKINQIAKKYNLKVVEDCAQAHGASYKGKKVGSLGDVGAFSFCQDKIISTGGEGGMLTTNNKEVWQKAWSYKDHGKDYDQIFNSDVKSNGFKWVHNSFGSNYRLTGIQAVIGLLQLKKLPQWHKKRTQNAHLLSEGFSKIKGLRVVKPFSHIEHAYYKYYAFIEPKLLKKDWDKKRIIQAINDEGVPCFWGSCSEMYLEKAFAKTKYVPSKRLTNAKYLDETGLMFLVHPTLLDEQMHYTVEVVKKVFSKAVLI